MINKLSNVPLYYQLKEELIKNIREGKFKTDEPITSENELCLQHSMSRPTVRQALGELVNMGYLYKIKGKGTFVSNISTKEKYDHTNGFLFSLLDCNDNSNREILSVEIVTGKTYHEDNIIDDYFSFEYVPNTENFYLKTIYTCKQNDNKVYCVSFLPTRYFTNAEELIKLNSMAFDIIGSKYPLDPVSSNCVTGIANSTEEMSINLSVPKNTPVLSLKSFLIARTGMCVEFNNVYYKGFTSSVVFKKLKKR